MFEPVKAGFGEFMGQFYASIVPTTKPLQAYVERGLAKSVAWAPARMVDAAEEMLSSWQRNDTSPQASKPADLPVILVGMAKDYTPTGTDYTRQMADRRMVMLPGDPKERLFGLRTVAGDIRAQVAIFATDEPTAKSLAAQFLLFLDGSSQRRFAARHQFAGLSLDWPVQIESPDSPAAAVATEAKNLTVLVVDLTLKASIPVLDYPKPGEPHDGKGTDGNPDNPHGYPVSAEVFTQALMS